MKMISLVAGLAFLLLHGLAASVQVEFTDTLSVLLGDGNTVDLSYAVDGDSIILQLETVFDAEIDEAWVGFGISERRTGSMKGSDIVTVLAKANGEFEVVDRHLGWVAFPMTPDSSFPGSDEVQDWEFVEGDFACEVENCTLTVTISRLLDTGDTEQDRVVDVTDANRIIAARGEGGFVSYHGAGRGSALLDFTKPVPSTSVKELLGDQVDDVIDLRMGNYSGMSNRVTTYACKSFVFDVQNDEPYDIVAIEPLLEQKNLPHLHHMILYQCLRPHQVQLTETLDSCSQVQNLTGAFCPIVSYAWASGGGPMLFPDDVAVRVGTEPGQLLHVMLEFHYDNPNKVPVVDNSGVRMHVSRTLRTHEAGILTLGDPLVSMQALEPSEACINRRGLCPSACTAELPHPITIFINAHHMHARGRQAYTKINGEVISRVDYWDQSFQDFKALNIVIQPGDELETVCNYDNSEEDSPIPFSLGSLDEMCQDFMYYYPRTRTGAGCGFFGGDTLCDLDVIGLQQDQFAGDHLSVSFLEKDSPCVIFDDPEEEEGGSEVSTSDDNDEKNPEKLDVLVLASIVICGVVFALVLVFVAWKKLRGKQQAGQPSETKEKMGP